MTHAFDALPKSALTHKPVLHFVHANGFPANVYQPLLDVLEVVFTVETIAFFGTNPHYPIDEHWQSLSQEVLDNIEKVCQKHSIKTLIAIGHSVGAVATLHAMHQDPTHISQTILLDPPILMGKHSFGHQLIKLADKALAPIIKTPHYLMDKYSISGKAKRRKDKFANKELARQNLSGKPLFVQFDKTCFELYIEHGFVADNDGIKLTIPKQQEADIFRTIPSLYWIKSPTIYRPTTLIVGQESHFDQLGSYQAVNKKWQIPLVYTKGTHMYPLEYPIQTAKLILTTIEKQ